MRQLDTFTVVNLNDNENIFADDVKDSDDQLTNKNNVSNTLQKNICPVSLFRCVTRLNDRHSLSKMSNSDELRLKVMELFSSNAKCADVKQVVDDSDNENHDDVKSPCTTITTIKQQKAEHNLNDIRQKVLEYEREQLKGVQFANAGSGNLKVVNSYTVTSNTCTII
jgi:phosphoglycerate-specific signal transduction histidine kinase